MAARHVQQRFYAAQRVEASAWRGVCSAEKRKSRSPLEIIRDLLALLVELLAQRLPDEALELDQLEDREALRGAAPGPHAIPNDVRVVGCTWTSWRRRGRRRTRRGADSARGPRLRDRLGLRCLGEPAYIFQGDVATAFDCVSHDLIAEALQ